MTSRKIVALVILAAVAEVTSWTIDLPLARKLFFTRNKDVNNIIRFDNGISVGDADTRFYDNIEPNSFHNADDYHYNKYVNENTDRDFDNRNYADAYKHQGYSEKQVHDIVRKGSVYLDGLRRSLERYAEVLKNCSQVSFNQTQNSTNLNQGRIPPFPATFNYTNPTDFMTSNFSIADIPQFNFTSTNFSELNPGWSNRDNMAMCAQATKRREHVRRWTDLALWATKRLEDNAYDAKYNKYYEQEEKELLIKLAMFLDRLAHYTGFEPNVEAFVNMTTTPRPPTNLSSTIELPFDNVPRDVVEQMINCLDSNSSEPAPDRCRYPLPLPEWVQNAYESRDPSFANARPQDPALSVVPPSQDSVPQSSSLELLETSDTASNVAPNTMTDVKSVQKRSIEENPLIKLMKYYGKHKVWVNSNPLDEKDVKKHENFDVPNHYAVKSIHKRSIFKNKKHINLKLPLPEPLHAIRDHVKKEAAIHLEKNKEQIKLLKGALEKMRHTASLTVRHNLKKIDHLKNIHKRSVTNERKIIPGLSKKINKRSVHYGQKYKPRVSEDPYQDISYYVKNQKGIEYNFNPAQAALVRLGLEQVFQTGNIEVVRRYGSNFNPLDPNPFYSGLLRGSLDV